METWEFRAFSEITKIYHFYDDAKDLKVETEATEIPFTYNMRSSDDKMEELIYKNVQVELCGQIPENNKSWGYIPLFEKVFEDFKATRSIKMSSYTHPKIHQMPDMAFNSGFS